MKKLVSLVLISSLVACEQVEMLDKQPEPNITQVCTSSDKEPMPDSIKVNLFEALRMASSEMSPMESQSRSNAMTVDSVMSEDGINYGNDGGFIYLFIRQFTSIGVGADPVTDILMKNICL